jgi:hypothetical protein
MIVQVSTLSFGVIAEYEAMVLLFILMSVIAIHLTGNFIQALSFCTETLQEVN